MPEGVVDIDFVTESVPEFAEVDIEFNGCSGQFLEVITFPDLVADFKERRVGGFS